MRALILFLFAVTLFAGDIPLPPLEDITITRCQINHLNGDNVVPGWHVHLVAEYTSREPWRLLYAVEDDQTKALKVCGDWMEGVRKALHPTKKVKK